MNDLLEATRSILKVGDGRGFVVNAVYYERYFVTAGGLISYGSDYLDQCVGCLGQKASSSRTAGGRIHLNLKLSRLSWSTDRQPISFMSRSISARRCSSALSTPA